MIFELSRRLALALLPLALASCAAAPLLAPAIAGAPTSVIVHFQSTAAAGARAALRQQFAARDVVPLLPDTERWHVPAGFDLQALQQQAGIKYAQPNTLHRLTVSPVAEAPRALATRLSSLPNDPQFTAQWNLQQANFPTAWAHATGRGITVAVIDSGVDPDHPDLKANLLPLIDEIQALGGTDMLGDVNYDGRDGYGHGTHVAGIIGAVTNNGVGVAGAAPDVKILPIKVAGADGLSGDDTLARGVADAIAGGARVINMSIGGGDQPSQLFQDEIDLALAHGVTLVVASGNDHLALEYPAASYGVIAVGAEAQSGQTASYSDFGPSLSVVAPGGGLGDADGPGILSTLPTYPCTLSLAGKPASYGLLAGTSMAAPHVAAAVALLLEQEPDLGPAQVWTRVASTARQRGLLGFTPDDGFGALDAAALLAGGSDDGR